MLNDIYDLGHADAILTKILLQYFSIYHDHNHFFQADIKIVLFKIWSINATSLPSIGSYSKRLKKSIWQK